MNRTLGPLSALLVLLGLGGCHAPMPDTYGIYADTNHGRIELRGQPPQRAGNMMSFYAGVPGPSGPECSSLKDFIVFQKDVDPSSVQLVHLQFLKEGNVSGLIGFGSARVNVNLWVPDKDRIEVDVKPVESHRDMYILVPHSPLEHGLYALSIGRFGGDVLSESRVFDLAVGPATDFPSYAQAAQTSKSQIEQFAPGLLKEMNDMSNHADYHALSDVYRPSGRILSDADAQSFATGNQTWIEGSGKIIDSKVVAVTPLGENSARCTVNTTYEKAGLQQEQITIGKIGDKYYITDMK